MKKYLVIIALLILISNISCFDHYSKENQIKFVNYLFEIGDHERCANEGLRTLNLYPDLKDEIAPLIIKAYFMMKDFKLVLSLIEKEQLPYNDSRYYALFKLKDYSGIPNHYESEFQKRILHYKYLINGDIQGLDILLGMGEHDADMITMKYYEELKGFKDKSPVLAAVMSAIIPGSGRIYSGRTTDGIFSMILITILSIKAYDNFSKKGMDDIEGWIFSGLGAYYYAGNIYGSYVSVIHRKREFLRRIENEIHLAFNINF